LLVFLERERASGDFLFRGQTRRYPPHLLKTPDRTLAVEPLYPADFRFFYKESESNEETNRMISSARDFGRDIRDMFCQFLTVNLAGIREENPWANSMVSSLENWPRRTPLFTSPFFRTCWSLAQHYLIATALTDLTFSPRVAGWFATNPWEADQPGPQPGDQGVIYCLNRDKTERLLEVATVMHRVMLNDESLPELFLVDIRSIPDSFAKRPTAQQGASLYGFDQPLVIELAAQSGILEIYTFVHQAGQDAGLTRDEVIPAEDPFRAIAALFEAIRREVKPVVASQRNTDNKGLDSEHAMERLQLQLGIPVRTAQRCERIPIDSRHVAFLYEGIETFGQVRYKYLLPVFDMANGAIVCVVSVEQSPALGAVKPEWLQACGISGYETLGLWSGAGHVTVEIGSWPDTATFQARAWPIVHSILGGSDSVQQSTALSNAAGMPNQ
jgi:hypothetical protein